MQPERELWRDNHLSSAIAKWISDDLGIVAKSSFILQLHGLHDIDIFYKAHNARNVIILTKDADFEPLVHELGAPPKIINITIGNADNKVLWTWLKPPAKSPGLTFEF